MRTISLQNFKNTLSRNEMRSIFGGTTGGELIAPKSTRNYYSDCANARTATMATQKTNARNTPVFPAPMYLIAVVSESRNIWSNPYSL